MPCVFAAISTSSSIVIMKLSALRNSQKVTRSDGNHSLCLLSSVIRQGLVYTGITGVYWYVRDWYILVQWCVQRSMAAGQKKIRRIKKNQTESIS